MMPIKAFIATLNSRNNTIKKMDIESIYDIKINNINSQPIDLHQFKGKHILIVNVASKCGFTPQYEDLQKLNETYKSKLQIIGVPCNQFGSQEPGDAASISSFCKQNYGVSFLITEKAKVKGSKQHPLYTWLTTKTNNKVKSSTVRWNFQKYLVSPEGKLIDYYFSTTNPLNSKITKHLK